MSCAALLCFCLFASFYCPHSHPLMYLSLSLSPLCTVFQSAVSFNQPLGDWDISKAHMEWSECAAQPTSSCCPPYLTFVLHICLSTFFVSITDPAAAASASPFHISLSLSLRRHVLHQCFKMHMAFARRSAVHGWPRALRLEMAGSPRPK